MRFFKSKKTILMLSALVPTSALISAGSIVMLSQAPIFRRVIPENMLKLSEDGTILYGFKDDVGVLDISRNRYNVLEIPDTVIQINNYAFASILDGLSNEVTEVDFNNNLESIGDYAFFKCWGIKTVVFKNSSQEESHLKSIGKSSFFQCGIEGELNLPNGLVSIGNHAFYYCESIRKLIIPSSLSEVGNYAFANMYQLWLIDLLAYNSIPDWLINISHCFRNNGTALAPSEEKVVKVNNSISTLSDWQEALYDRQDLPASDDCSFNIVTNETVVPEEFFIIEKKEKEKKKTYILKGFVGDITQWIKNYSIIQIPSKVNKISANLFKGKIKAENGAKCHLILNGSLQQIEESAFEDCTGLVGDLEIPSSTSILKDNVFNNCRFSTVSMGSGLSKVGSYEFSNNPSLIEAKISCSPEAEKFEGKLFRNCPNLQHIDFTSLGNALPKALEETTGNNVIFKEGEVALTGYISVGEDATWTRHISADDGWNFKCFSDKDPNAKWFIKLAGTQGCSEEMIDMARVRTVVKGMTTEGVKKVTSYNLVHLPITTQLIANNAFKHLFDRDIEQENPHFWQVDLNEGIKTIGDYAFYQCTGLEQLFHLPSTLENIGNYAFAECNGLRGWFTLPTHLKKIGSGAFLGCTNFAGGINLGGNLDIGDAAFMDTSFSFVKITDSLPKTFGSRIISHCDYLTSIDLTSCSYEQVSQNWQYQSDTLAGNVGAQQKIVHIPNTESVELWSALLHNMGLPNDWIIKQG